MSKNLIPRLYVAGGLLLACVSSCNLQIFLSNITGLALYLVLKSNPTLCICVVSRTNDFHHPSVDDWTVFVGFFSPRAPNTVCKK